MKIRLPLVRHWTLTLILCVPLAPALAEVPIPAAREIPYERTGDPETRSIPFLSWHRIGALKARGYTEKESLFSGLANSYQYVDRDGANVSPEVEIVPNSTGDYTTRMLLRMPANPEDFNGVVYMEILNATARYDGAPMWDLTLKSIIADGAAWVGVTYSDTTAAFMRDAWGTTNFPSPEGSQPRNRSRYASLNITTRAHTWDILNQAAALLKADRFERNPLSGYGVSTIIVTGYSQSAAYVTTFANSFYPAYSEARPCTPELEALDRCQPVVDGHIIAAGGEVSRNLDGATSNPLANQRNCSGAIRRQELCIETASEPPIAPDDFKLPKVVRFTTESDIGSVRVRQFLADEPLLRTYEAAGAAHVGGALTLQGQNIARYQFGIEPSGSSENRSCVLPLNPLRTGIPLSAVQRSLARWIQFDEEPIPSQFMDWEGDFDIRDPVTFRPAVAWLRDDGDNDASDGDNGVGDSNALNGLRSPRIDVPLGTYFGSNSYDGPLPSTNAILCSGIIGGYDAFSDAEVLSRYGTGQAYLQQIWWQIFLGLQEGTLLRADARGVWKRAVAYAEETF